MSSPHLFDSLPDPPDLVSLANARISLQHRLKTLGQLNDKISVAEAELAQIVREATCAINELNKEKSLLEDQIVHTQSYLAPIRRLPTELLRYVFTWCFEDNPCVAWTLSAIRLLTTQTSSPDVIRLWLERSGPSVPLDIEIYLRVTKTSTDPSPSSRLRRRSSSPGPGPSYFSLYPPYATQSAHYVIPHHPSSFMSSANHIVLDISPASMPPSPHLASGIRGERGVGNGLHWGHIAMFYLVEQIRRWERFVFRFDKQFHSLVALKSIHGDAPLLKEFEIAASEPLYNQESVWLPTFTSSPPAPSPTLPRLRHLTLHYATFKSTSPLFGPGLHTLSLRSLPSTQLPLDRLTSVLNANKQTLRVLALNFAAVTPAILPLVSLCLPEVRELSLGGHYLLSSLMEILVLPQLEELNVDVEVRDAVEEVITSLISRMANAPEIGDGIKHLSVAYGWGSGRGATIRRRSANLSWNPQHENEGSPKSIYCTPVSSWNFLSELPQLESLRVGGVSMDLMLTALGVPEDDMQPLPTPQCTSLKELGMKHCHGHAEGVAKLVQFVESRNQEDDSESLVELEIIDCGSYLTPDVVAWLEERVEKVKVVDSVNDR
ncbi:hypothetical protein VNI00_003262 [Paramarasmius palmivorus]|uniref:F-box domain-containing protein n=1 Tax=Paramarasmius palmivorus TaxID=297713 RepID=A0AAW0DSI9_9AGAR